MGVLWSFENVNRTMFEQVKRAYKAPLSKVVAETTNKTNKLSRKQSCLHCITKTQLYFENKEKKNDDRSIFSLANLRWNCFNFLSFPAYNKNND